MPDQDTEILSEIMKMCGLADKVRAAVERTLVGCLPGPRSLPNFHDCIDPPSVQDIVTHLKKLRELVDRLDEEIKRLPK